MRAVTFIALDAELRTLPGTTKARNMIVSESLAYLTSLGRDARGDADRSIDIGNRRRPQMIEVDGDTGTVRIVGD